MNRISYTDIEEIVGFPISEECKQIINILDTSFSPLTQQERDDVILNIINHIDLDLEKTGQHRLEKWEKGWYENFELLKNGAELSSLVPKYFGKYDIVRWKGDFVKANNIHLDYYQISILVDAILHEYVGDKYSNLFEFGCGPAYHLLRFEGFNNKTNLINLSCTINNKDDFFIFSMFLVFNSFIPNLLMILCTICLCYTVFQSRRKTQANQNIIKDIKFTIISLSLNLNKNKLNEK
jgi:hypothetical protein